MLGRHDNRYATAAPELSQVIDFFVLRFADLEFFVISAFVEIEGLLRVRADVIAATENFVIMSQ